MSKQFPASDVGLLVLRLGLGIVFIARGYQKISQGWGAAWEPSMEVYAQLPVAWIEFIGGISILLGLLTRFSALAICGGMCMAIYLVSASVGFVGPEFGDQARSYAYLKVGWEFPFAMLMQALALVFLGGGAYSVDYCIWGRGRTATGAASPPAASTQSAAVAAGAAPSPGG